MYPYKGGIAPLFYTMVIRKATRKELKELKNWLTFEVAKNGNPISELKDILSIKSDRPNTVVYRLVSQGETHNLYKYSKYDS
jgi:hypothetical protein